MNFFIELKVFENCREHLKVCFELDEKDEKRLMPLMKTFLRRY